MAGQGPAISVVTGKVLCLRCANRRSFCRLFHRNHTAFDRFLYFLESTHFNLAYALARDAELRRKIFKRDRIIRQTPCFKDATLAFIENIKR